MTDSGPSEPGPEVTLGDDGSLVTVDLSSDAQTVGGVVGRVVLGIVLIIVGLAVAVGAVVGAVASVFYDATLEWADLIADAALFVVPIGFGIAVVGFAVLRRARKRKAGSYDAVAETIEAMQQAPQQSPPPSTQPPKTLI